jgi:predicted peroxiredoxin
VQTVYTSSPDILDRTAATLIIQAIMAKDLDAISQIFQRIEGGAIEDVIVQERAQVEMRL